MKYPAGVGVGDEPDDGFGEAVENAETYNIQVLSLYYISRLRYVYALISMFRLVVFHIIALHSSPY